MSGGLIFRLSDSRDLSRFNPPVGELNLSVPDKIVRLVDSPHSRRRREGRNLEYMCVRLEGAIQYYDTQ